MIPLHFGVTAPWCDGAITPAIPIAEPAVFPSR